MLIMCKGKMAKKPFSMPFTGEKVYSLEELCYYIYHHIYTITEDFFNKDLVTWFLEEAGQETLAKKVDNLLEIDGSIKDFVVTILCGCDYYKEAEIRKIIDIIDETENLPIHKRKKTKADNLLRAGRYGRSLSEYRKLLHGSFAVNFSTEEYGDLLHNQGIAHFYTSSFDEAAMDFKEAYSRNNNRESIKHYLWILLMQGKEQMFEAEAKNYSFSTEEIFDVRMKYKEAIKEAQTKDYSKKGLEEYKAQVKSAFDEM